MEAVITSNDDLIARAKALIERRGESRSDSKIVQELIDALEAQSAPMVADSREALAKKVFQISTYGPLEEKTEAWKNGESLREHYLMKADALLASGVVSLAADRDREVAERAWDEGYTRGFYDRERLTGDARDASEGQSENPHDRAESEGE